MFAFFICVAKLMTLIYKLQISDLTSRMQSEWPTLACPSSNGLTFWGHEWDKHGTCSESVLNQHSYFATTLGLKNEINLLQALKSAGMIYS